jgi:hypothetical protein
MSPKKDDLHDRVLALELQRKSDRERDDLRDKWLREVHREIVGEGDTPGLRVRVDRVETKYKLLVSIGSGIATVLGLAAAFIGLRK